VWEYWNPAVHPTYGDRTGAVRWAERFVEGDIDFPLNNGVIVNKE
jgi:hypothetical protein